MKHNQNMPSHFIQNFDAYLIDCETFFIINIPEDLKFFLNKQELDTMRTLAEEYICHTFIFG